MSPEERDRRLAKVGQSVAVQRAIHEEFVRPDVPRKERSPSLPNMLLQTAASTDPMGEQRNLTVEDSMMPLWATSVRCQTAQLLQQWSEAQLRLARGGSALTQLPGEILFNAITDRLSLLDFFSTATVSRCFEEACRQQAPARLSNFCFTSLSGSSASRKAGKRDLRPKQRSPEQSTRIMLNCLRVPHLSLLVRCIDLRGLRLAELQKGLRRNFFEAIAQLQNGTCIVLNLSDKQASKELSTLQALRNFRLEYLN
eukprot:gnl/TRDRNA2_/TRDRNA2_110502_c0_seq1.p1 gnl/TRDRNA2_/TRDRNA2_110502_c0~~gnl/TRDRNA2_/TRDRNA2_110502_c0_seq1.p1  ORF type:complete len:294 (+),score=28.50 gnl/TRDRNA2_/TRDRNA2_110502_c0_seq1:120-884(+)